MTDTSEWEGRTGKGWAAEWRRTDRSWGGLTEELLRRTREFPLTSVLDIGCGAGELSLAIARGRPDVPVLGVDISARLIEVAQERGRNLTNAAFALGDASAWSPPAGAAPDFLISRHGVMFFDDPVAAFTHIARISAPDASLLFSCFRGPAENEIFTGMRSLLPAPATPPDPHAPGPMAFADPDRVHAILTRAGWAGIEIQPFDFAMVVGSGEDPVAEAVAYFRSIGAAAAASAGMSPAEREALFEKVHDYVAARELDGLVAFSAAAWIVSARRD